MTTEKRKTPTWNEQSRKDHQKYAKRPKRDESQP